MPDLRPKPDQHPRLRLPGLFGSHPQSRRHDGARPLRAQIKPRAESHRGEDELGGLYPRRAAGMSKWRRKGGLCFLAGSVKKKKKKLTPLSLLSLSLLPPGHRRLRRRLQGRGAPHRLLELLDPGDQRLRRLVAGLEVRRRRLLARRARHGRARDSARRGRRGHLPRGQGQVRHGGAGERRRGFERCFFPCCCCCSCSGCRRSGSRRASSPSSSSSSGKGGGSPGARGPCCRSRRKGGGSSRCCPGQGQGGSRGPGASSREEGSASPSSSSGS